MAIPSPDREQNISSATGYETSASGVIAKGSLWFIYERFQTLSLREYQGAHFPSLRESVPVFHLSQALDAGLNIVTDRFWLWEITTANELNLIEVEPFTNRSPVIHSITSIESGVENVRVDLIEGEAVRVFILKTGSPNQQWLYVYVDVKSGVPTVTSQLTWSATRLDNYDSVTDSTALTTFQVVYADTASPPNIYTISYSLSVPQIISATQVGDDVNVFWDTITGGEMYRLERSIDDPSFAPANTTIVYYGSNTNFTDVAVGYVATFYYRVKLVMPSLSIESAWSSTVSVFIAPAIPFYVYSDRISQDGYNPPVDSTWMATFGEWNVGYIPPFVISEPRYWVANSDSTWADTTNWSYTSGGPGGAPLPILRNTVIFDGGGTGECDVDTTVDIRGMVVNLYPGVIRQNSYDINIDSSGAIFWTGDFSGSGENIRVSGDLIIGGVANFLSTDQTLSCDSTFQYINTAIFNHNDGIISLDSSGCMLDASTMRTATLQFNTEKARVSASCYVGDLLVLNTGSARHTTFDSTLIVRGDASFRANYDQWTNFNNLSILLDGTAEQKIINEIGCIVPTLFVDKNTTPQAICSGGSPLRIKGDFGIYDGTFNTNGLDVQVGL